MQGPPAIAQPDPVAVDQSQPGQDGVDEADIGVEHLPPEDAGDHRRHRPGQDHHHPQEAAAAEGLVEQQGDEEAENGRGDGDDQAEIDRAQDRVGKARRGEEVGIVLQGDEFAQPQPDQVEFRNTQRQGEDGRIGVDAGDQQQRRGDHDGGASNLAPPHMAGMPPPTRVAVSGFAGSRLSGGWHQ